MLQKNAEIQKSTFLLWSLIANLHVDRSCEGNLTPAPSPLPDALGCHSSSPLTASLHFPFYPWISVVSARCLFRPMERFARRFPTTEVGFTAASNVDQLYSCQDVEPMTSM